MKFFNKEEKVEEKLVKPTTVYLDVHFLHKEYLGIKVSYFNTSDSNTYRGYMNTKGVKDFYKWYFGRPQSKHFRMIFKDGEYLLLRAHIAYVKISVR